MLLINHRLNLSVFLPEKEDTMMMCVLRLLLEDRL